LDSPGATAAGRIRADGAHFPALVLSILDTCEPPWDLESYLEYHSSKQSRVSDQLETELTWLVRLSSLLLLLLLYDALGLGNQ
jgi:hypothetical protein